ncbi:HAD-IA family hydrolase [Acidithiobacillus sp. CV18-2]|uniref:HAD-IA family hydrolase n=1 Tax=Igneacidithiobacillus copahuensis TaxID=2724909 RepID=A0AAE2YS88_9PROT|nr:HAD-IA family hydrolase [Igneacidithiobacillus copahuensis]MBU2753592.1 HAD-IA family hydrolase [Acidithiobacillus sp. CV18-3]MBU2757335.1 HAD-IA family hydrolase [Acidithiobacillus sp. BN09-2]MBU2776086.1 HAD-IA family hydrolase [Acidithiobacillus sp. CV18-2]MBU2795417.1 HAD-IA family hydrolase [Acidithiobacillus sp. VAN18-2]MBU2800237.1 HAD-IA family hydrolase [Acidithiobacillus sp. VAN18-4]UTV82309.1 HAD-IA family hydrolase [Acidithiobacillus sp. YTS05]
MMHWQALLFDLDGTLVDSAPDLVGAVQDLARERNLPVPAFDALRRMASHGAPGLLGKAFGITPADPDYAQMRLDFLRLYRARAHRASVLFPGILQTLRYLSERQIPWAIVTNKSEELTHDLLGTLALPYPPAIVVGGDTTEKPKPSPLPVQYALRHLGIEPEATVFLGDDRRDIEAAHAAGCHAWAASWGYWQESDPPSAWGANVVLEDADALRARLLAN